MSAKQYDIGIIGNICSVDINTATSLSKLGAKVLVFRKWNDKDLSAADTYSQNGSSEFDVYTSKGSLDFFVKACSCRILFSFTGAVLGPLKKVYPLRFLPMFPPIVNISTGSDITELLGERSLKGFLYRIHLRFSTLNWLVEYPHGLKNILKYKIPNVYFMPFPAFRLPEKKLPLPESNDKIIFFHPSHLDWRVSDPDENRNSSKGNDRFIKAFIRAVKNGLDAECILLYRGPDRDLALKMVEDSGIKERFIWKQALTRDELFDAFLKCHVVVDQFDVGGLGGIAVEAMASGRPVMTYIEENCSRLQYGGDIPPVINCWSEEEIYRQINNCIADDFLGKKAQESHLWVNRQHRPHIVYDKILFYVALLTGKRIKDYGWLKNAYSQKKHHAIKEKTT